LKMFEPYAAKATIEHTWNSGTLNIWMTFRFPMNQLVQPAEAVWVVDVDGTDYTPDTSAWQDAFTMLLTLSGISTFPAIVRVKFDGPDAALETTWHKNWEPWGYIPSVDLSATYLPTGMIMLWSGTIASIPTGWALCDGTGGTPDLRNRFIVCADADAGGVAKSTVENATALQIGGRVDHIHKNGGAVQVTGTTGTASGASQVQSGTGIYVAHASHSHSFNGGGALQGDTQQQTYSTGQADGLDLVPPFFALAYIMKL
jgi:hypothetical protein